MFYILPLNKLQLSVSDTDGSSCSSWSTVFVLGFRFVKMFSNGEVW